MTPELKDLRIDRTEKVQTPKRKPGRRVKLLIGGVLLFIGFGVAGAFLVARDPKPGVQVVTVHAEQASPGEANVILNATGYIVAAHKIDVATNVDGRVEWIGVEKGDQAKKGQPLVRLEADDYRAKVREAAGQVNYLRAKLVELTNGSRPEEVAKADAEKAEVEAEFENARISLLRTRQLADARVLSRQALDDAMSRFNQDQAKFNSLERSYELTRVGPRAEEIEAARGQLEQAKGALAYAQTQLQNTVIHAPIAGTILERNVEPGEFVTTGFVSDNGARGYVVSLADLHQLQVELDISQNDFARLEPDQRAVVTTDAYPDRKYEGVIDQISPVANRQKATVEVKVKINNPDYLLRPDMNASVAFLASAEQGSSREVSPIVNIPRTAVRDEGVFLVVDGSIRYRKLRLGVPSSDSVPVSDGLRDGDQIVANPGANLKEGQKVRAVTKDNQ